VRNTITRSLHKNITRVKTSGSMRWVGYVARMGKIEMYTKFLSENLKGRDQAEDLRVGER